MPQDPTTLLKDQVVARYTIADFRQAQSMDIVIGTLKRLMKNPKGNLSNVPKSLREGIKAYFRQAKDRLYVNGQGILCLRRRPADRNRFSNHSMILMPQVYQAEILYQTHNEMGHQGVNKVVARIQQRHDWMGLQLAVNKWINACMTCQQRKNPAGPVRFALQNIVSHKFNELVQFDHVKICKSKKGNRYILVMIDHFTKYAEAVPCNAQEMTAEATVRKILSTWFARHGTPSIMQSDNGPQFIAEVSRAFMKASQLTQAHSTAHHPATNGLVERQNKTLINMLSVFCSRRMHDWDEYLDEVMGAYNSTRHASTGYTPHVLVTGQEKSIPLSFLYPEFAAEEFEDQSSYLQNLVRRQQEIHELVRRNTHQAQLRQKRQFDRGVRGKPFEVDELVWVFCRVIPKGGSAKLLRGWRGPYRVVEVLQEGRIYTALIWSQGAL